MSNYRKGARCFGFVYARAQHHILVLCVCLWLVITVSCVTRAALFSPVDELVAQEQYNEAILLVEADREKNRLYHKDLDRVLYHLDLGVLLYFDGQHQRSNAHLHEAERLIEEYYTQSITQQIGSFLLNDKVIEYPGEDFEDLYINLFKALNYIALQEYDSAFVEVRRMNEKIKYLETKYDVAHERLSDNASAEVVRTSSSQGTRVAPFTASAFSYFLSMLLYGYDREWDDSTIDYRALTQLLAQQRSQLLISPSDFVSPRQWQNSQNSSTRVVVFAFVGLSPEKVEEAIFLAIDDIPLQITLPVLFNRDSQIRRVGIFDGQGKLVRDLGLLESVEQIAESTFERRKALIYAKNIARALAKGITASVSTALLHEAGVPIVGEIFQILAAASEGADLRAARYLPAHVYLYDQLIDSNASDVESWEVRFLSRNGRVLCAHPLRTPVSAQRLHVETATCIR